MKKACIVVMPGKPVQYMVQHALDRVYEIVGVCKERGVNIFDELEHK